MKFVETYPKLFISNLLLLNKSKQTSKFTFPSFAFLTDYYRYYIKWRNHVLAKKYADNLFNQLMSQTCDCAISSIKWWMDNAGCANDLRGLAENKEMSMAWLNSMHDFDKNIGKTFSKLFFLNIAKTDSAITLIWRLAKSQMTKSYLHMNNRIDNVQKTTIYNEFAIDIAVTW